MSTEPGGVITDNEAVWACIRTIVVPHGVVPVKRTSPVPFRKRTPLRKHPYGEAMSRAGGREWFGDRLFVEKQQGHERAGYTAAIVVHIVVALLLTAAVLMGAEHPMIVTARSSLVMPVMAVPLIAEEAAASRSVEPPAPKAAPEARIAAPAPPAAISTPAPVEAPTEITPETSAERNTDGNKSGVESGGVEGGVQGGAGNVDGGIASGVGGGTADGVPGSSSAGASAPIRSLTPPRKIKDVKPVYPQGAFAGQTRGTVVILATIGPDGKVQDAQVLRSVPGLDHAALTAVQQWEYEPPMLNGAPVSIILTVVINFGIH